MKKKAKLYKAKPTTKKSCIHGSRSCLVCSRAFAVYPKGKKKHNHGPRAKYKRPNWSKTCSKVCSRKYLRDRTSYLKKTKTRY